MLRALGEYVVEGVPTTIPVHEWILGSEAFIDSTHTTTWLEKALVDAHLPAQGDLAAGASSRAPRPRDILVEVDGRRVPVRIFDERREAAPRSPSTHGGHHGEHVHGEIRAPMQGTIVKVLVAQEDAVEPGQALLVLEAMKMENHINAERGGTVKEVRVAAGDTVGTGDVLIVIE
jgi:acetyl-CoA/propionyl-CoA carboxylase biotin carboxyl carrier protein